MQKKQGIEAVVDTRQGKVIYYDGFYDTVADNMALLNMNPKEIGAIMFGQGMAEQTQGLVPFLIAAAQHVPVYFKYDMFEYSRGVFSFFLQFKQNTA